MMVPTRGSCHGQASSSRSAATTTSFLKKTAVSWILVLLLLLLLEQPYVLAGKGDRSSSSSSSDDTGTTISTTFTTTPIDETDSSVTVGGFDSSIDEEDTDGGSGVTVGNFDPLPTTEEEEDNVETSTDSTTEEATEDDEETSTTVEETDTTATTTGSVVRERSIIQPNEDITIDVLTTTTTSGANSAETMATESKTVTTTYEGEQDGYVVLGYENNDTDNDGETTRTVIIGIPDEDTEDGSSSMNVYKYALAEGDDPADAVLLPDDQQTLTDATLVSNGTHTVLQFTDASTKTANEADTDDANTDNGGAATTSPDTNFMVVIGSDADLDSEALVDADITVNVEDIAVVEQVPSGAILRNTFQPNADVTIDVVTNTDPSNASRTVTTTYEGPPGYVVFEATSPSDSTTGDEETSTSRTVIIGRAPNDDEGSGATVSSRDVSLYTLEEGQSITDAVPLPEEEQTLTNAAIVQNSTHTVLQFTEPLDDASLSNIVASSAETTTDGGDTPPQDTNFAYTIGASNDLESNAVIVEDVTVNIVETADIDTDGDGTVDVIQDDNYEVNGVAVEEEDSITVDGIVLRNSIKASDDMAIDIVTDTGDTEVMTVTATYEGPPGYITFNIADDDTDSSTTTRTIIGIPDDESGVVSTNVHLYDMAGDQRPSDAEILPEDQQTLIDATIVQNDTHTVLSFTQPLDDGATTTSNSRNINIARDTNFEYAVGSDVDIDSDVGQEGAVTVNLLETADVIEQSSSVGENSTVVVNGVVLRSTIERPDDGVTIDIVTDTIGDTDLLTVTTTYEGPPGYVAFAFASDDVVTADDSVSTTTAIVGVPADENGATSDNVYKYAMVTNNRSPADVEILSDDQQTLTDATVVQNDTHTVLKFTKPLVESIATNEVGRSIDIGQDTNFVYTVGTNNDVESNIARDGIVGVNLLETATIESIDADATVKGVVFRNTIKLDDDITIDIVTDTGDAQSRSVTTTYEGPPGYIAFALSSNEDTDSTTAIIGIPSDESGTVSTNVYKYDMSDGQSPTEAVELADDQQTLTDATIVQNGTHTVLHYTESLTKNSTSIDEAASSAMNIASDANLEFFVGSENAIESGVAHGANVTVNLLKTAVDIDRSSSIGENNTVDFDGVIFRSTIKRPDDGVTIDVVTDTTGDADSMTVTTSYEGPPGYVAFAFAEDNVATADSSLATAVVGIPSDETGTTSDDVYKYEMVSTSRSPADVELLPDDQQTLTDATIVQNDTHTVLTFTKPLDEGLSGTDEVGRSIDVAQDTNFVYTIGSTNDLDSDVRHDGIVSVNILENADIDTIGTSNAASGETLISGIGGPIDLGNGRLRNIIERDDGVLFDIITDSAEETIDVTMTYEGLGYVAFAFSNDLNMPDSTAIIGLPEGEGESDNVMKYELTSRSSDGTVPLPDAQQSLTNANVVQNETHTVLHFSKPLVEENTDEVGGNLDVGADMNFLYAVGSSNSLSRHKSRDAFSMNLSSGASAVAKDYQTAWRWHGFCMAFAWILLVPSAVASSILRAAVPFFQSGVWFTYHRALNMAGVLLTIIGFIIAVVIFNKQQGASVQHFKVRAHHTIGLIVFIFALIQAIGGTFRPHVEPAPPATDIEATSKSDSEANPEKSTLRRIWEGQHKLTGAIILILAWYNVISGINLYYARGLGGGSRAASIVIACLIVALVIIMTALRLFAHRRVN